MIILAIDLGKFNSMCCFFNTKTQEYSFWPAATTRGYMQAPSMDAKRRIGRPSGGWAWGR